jgi:hypothetical protein
MTIPGFNAGLSLRQSIQEGPVNISYEYKHKESIKPSGAANSCDSYCYSWDYVHRCCCREPRPYCGRKADGDCTCRSLPETIPIEL